MKADAVLFAAGRGERLRPLTDLVPKPALPLLDVPLGAFGLRVLTGAGRKTLVNLSHLAAAAESALAPFAPGATWYREPDDPFGTGGTLREAYHAGLLAAEVVTWNADVIAPVDIEALVASHRESGAPATALVVAVAEGADFLVEGGRAIGFLDRRQAREAAGARFAGIGVFSLPDVLGLVPPDGPAGLGESVLGPLARRQELNVVIHPGPALDVGTPAAFLRASLGFLNGDIEGPPPPGRVRGGTYLGEGAEAPEECLGRGAVLLRGAVAEPGSRIESSIVFPGERVPRGSRLTGSIWVDGNPLEA